MSRPPPMNHREAPKSKTSAQHKLKVAEALRSMSAASSQQTPAGFAGEDYNLAGQNAASPLVNTANGYVDQVREHARSLVGLAEDASGIPFSAAHEVAGAAEGGRLNAMLHGTGKAIFASAGGALGSGVLPGPGTVAGAAAGSAAYDNLRAAAADPSPPLGAKTKNRLDPVSQWFQRD